MFSSWFPLSIIWGMTLLIKAHYSSTLTQLITYLVSMYIFSFFSQSAGKMQHDFPVACDTWHISLSSHWKEIAGVTEKGEKSHATQSPFLLWPVFYDTIAFSPFWLVVLGFYIYIDISCFYFHIFLVIWHCIFFLNGKTIITCLSLIIVVIFFCTFRTMFSIPEKNCS